MTKRGTLMISTRKILQTIRKLSQAEIVFYVLPALMVLLTVFTVAQGQVGLYAAYEKFFGAFIIFLGPVPLPGGYTLLSLVTLSLTLKFIFHSEWRWRKAGIILAHLGALVLMIGGLFTAITAREGFMIIAEGEQTPYVYDYTQRSLFIFADNMLRKEILFADIPTALNNPEHGFAMTLINRCSNCKIIKREEAPEQNQTDLRSMAQFMALESQPEERDPEANLSGLTFEINGASNPEENGTYIAFEGMPKPIEINAAGVNYKIMFGKQQRALPFDVVLKDFVKTDYPGTTTARAYHSDILIQDGDLSWPVRIEMNKPFRYKGYTLFQSSFDQSQERETTILSVVENKGLVLPYFSSILMALGLITHLIITGQSKTNQAQRPS